MMATGRVICPNCGAENIDSPIVTTCSSCLGSLEGGRKVADRCRVMEETGPAAPPEAPPAPPAAEPEEAAPSPPEPPPTAPEPAPAEAPVEAGAELPPPALPAPPRPPELPPAAAAPEEPAPVEAPAEEEAEEEPERFDFRPPRAAEVAPIVTTEPVAPPPPPLMTERPVKVEIEEERRPARPPTPAERTECPRCRAGNPPEYRFCAVCGERLPEPSEVPVATPERTTCPRCQRQNPPGRIFCQGCGLDLRLDLTEIEGKPWSPPDRVRAGARILPEAPKVSRTSGTSKWGACCGCLVFIAIAFLFYLLSNVARW